MKINKEKIVMTGIKLEGKERKMKAAKKVKEGNAKKEYKLFHIKRKKKIRKDTKMIRKIQKRRKENKYDRNLEQERKNGGRKQM